MIRILSHYRQAIAVLLVVTGATTPLAAAEDPAQGTVDPVPRPWVMSVHRFLDNTNALLTGIETAGLITDASSTRRVLDQYPGLTFEGDPLARPFVERGWPGQIAGGVLLVAAELGGRYALHRSGHHRLERVLPLVLGALEFGVTVHNIRGLHALDRETGALRESR